MRARADAILCLATFCAPAAADVINVPADWPTIQLAINNSSPGDEIVIADGTYVGSFDTFGNDLTIRSASGDPATVTIVGNDSWTIFVASFETVTIRNLRIQNPGAKGIFVHNQSTVNLDGCHLRLMNGPNATEGAIVHLRGGSTLSAVDCLFENSTNVGSGGAIGVTDGASASIAGCTFNNIATTGGSANGGGLYVNNGSIASLADCFFLNLTAAGDGGGVYVSSSGSIDTIENCSFTNLHANGLYGGCGASKGGAIYYVGSQPLTVSMSTFSQNSSRIHGGAIYSEDQLTAIECEFTSNSTALSLCGNQGGGAIWAGGALTALGCDFRENAVPSNGGAVYCSSSYTITDSAFLCNVAATGGAIRLLDVPAPETIDNCFFALNDADDGGAISSSASANAGPGISNTTFCGNHIGQIKGGWINQGGNLISTFCLATPPIDCDTEWPFQSHLCIGDIVHDGVVGVQDLIQLILAWGTPNLTVDLDSDGTVDVQDLVLLISNWGACR